MGKCARCGKESFLFKNFELKDGEICKKCFRALGFDKSYDLITSVYSYEEIKDGIDEMYRKKNEAKKPSLSDLSEDQKEALIHEIVKNSFGVQYGGKEKALECEPEEEEIFNILCAMFGEIGKNPEQLDFVRLSDNYVTAKLGEWDLARFHWGIHAKWVLFPTVENSKTKHRIHAPEEIKQFSELLQKSAEHIEKYS